MGRGRAKAKQVKVARRLKYNSGNTDLDRLAAELGLAEASGEDDTDDAYDELAAKYAGDDEDDDSPDGAASR